MVTLEYKNLRKYCFHCQRLTHDAATCPGLIKAKDASKQDPTLPPPRRTNPASGQNTEYHKSSSREHQASHSEHIVAREDYTSKKRRYDDRELRYNTPSRSRGGSLREANSHHTPTRSLNYSRREQPGRMDRYHQSTQKSNLQWRERIIPASDLPGSSETSRTRRPPLERESIVGESLPSQVIIPTKEAVMDELREVTVQYTSCADPTESMARKQRVLQGEARGMMADTAAQILAASPVIFQEQARDTDIQLTPQLPLSPDVPIHPAEQEATGKVTAKKKRGRPPLNKPGNKSPLKLTGAKSSKRNKEIIQVSPKRKPTGDKANPTGKDDPNNYQRVPAKQRLSIPGDVAGPSNTREPPQTVLIPAMVRKKVDFQNPLPPLL